MATTGAGNAAIREEFLSLLYRGGELLAAGSVGEAVGHLEQAYRLDPKNEKAQNLLGLAYFKIGMFEQAAEIYEALVRDNPIDPTLRVNLGLVYLKADSLQRALREFTLATDLAPEHKKAQNYLGVVLAQLGDYGRAREHFLLAGSQGMAEKMTRALAGEDLGEESGEGVASGSGRRPEAPREPVREPPVQPAALAGPSPEAGVREAPPRIAEPLRGQTLSFASPVPTAAGGGQEPSASPRLPNGLKELRETPSTPRAEVVNFPKPDRANGSAGKAMGWGVGVPANEDASWAPPAGGISDAFSEAQGQSFEAPAAAIAPGAEAGQAGGFDAGAAGMAGYSSEVAYAAQDYPPEFAAGGEEIAAGSYDASLGYAPQAEQAVPPEGLIAEAGVEASPEGEILLEASAAEMVESSPEAAGAPVEGSMQLEAPGLGTEGQQASEGGLELELEVQAQAQPRAAPEVEVVIEPGPQETMSIDAGAVAAAVAEPGVGASNDATGAQAGGEDLGPAAMVESGGTAGAEAASLTFEAPAAVPEEAASAEPLMESGGETLERAPTARSGRGGRSRGSGSSASPAGGAAPARKGHGARGTRRGTLELEAELERAEAREAERAAEQSRLSEAAPKPLEAVPSGAGASAPAHGTAVATEVPAVASEGPGLGAISSAPWKQLGRRKISELAKLGELMPDPLEGPFHVGEELVALVVEGELLARVGSRVAELGSLSASPERKRAKGRVTEKGFGAGADQMVRLSGQGTVLLGAGKRRYVPMELDDESSSYFREDTVAGFEESVMFENGRMTGDASLELELVHLRGKGSVLLRMEGELRSLRVREGRAVTIPLERLVGWYGTMTPRLTAVKLDGQAKGKSGAVELTGEGVAFLCVGP